MIDAITKFVEKYLYHRDKSTKTRKYEFSLPSGPSAKNVLFQYITHQRGGEGEKFNFTLMVESCWGHVGVMFGSCWDQLGTNLNFPFQWATLDLTLDEDADRI